MAEDEDVVLLLTPPSSIGRAKAVPAKAARRRLSDECILVVAFDEICVNDEMFLIANVRLTD